ncbi:MAG TPA: hypothetical protein VMG30_05135, partial [Acidobacteriota bacterium]|nr:hypothetical protein [Acidobacteriota bacterium]
IAGLDPRARMFSFEHAQLLAKSNNFKSEIASGTEKGTEKYDKTDEIWNHRIRCISYLPIFDICR